MFFVVFYTTLFRGYKHFIDIISLRFYNLWNYFGLITMKFLKLMC